MWFAAEEDKDEEEMAASEGVSWLEGRSGDNCVSARDIVLSGKLLD